MVQAMHSGPPIRSALTACAALAGIEPAFSYQISPSEPESNRRYFCSSPQPVTLATAYPQSRIITTRLTTGRQLFVSVYPAARLDTPIVMRVVPVFAGRQPVFTVPALCSVRISSVSKFDQQPACGPWSAQALTLNPESGVFPPGSSGCLPECRNFCWALLSVIVFSSPTSWRLYSVSDRRLLSHTISALCSLWRTFLSSHISHCFMAWRICGR